MDTITQYTFESDFTRDLESFVKNPLQIIPIDKWNPYSTAAPERHVVYGRVLGLSYNDIYIALETYNNAFHDIENLFRIYLTDEALRSLGSIHPVHEQVWLFGYKWLQIYQNLLTVPNILRSQFYKNTHERFLNVLGSMLVFQSTKRATFVSALRIWDSKNKLLIPVVIDDDADAICEFVTDNLSMKDQPHVKHVVRDESLPRPLLMPRLVLAQRQHGVRSKTRKSLRNLNRFQSNGNNGLPSQD